MAVDWKTEVVPMPWEHAGFDCAIIRNEEIGHLCGYVRIPEGHPLFRVAYSDPAPAAVADAVKVAEVGPIGKRGVIDVFIRALNDECMAGMLFDVHGSVTYSGEANYYLPPGFWYGFDCGHAGDSSPMMSERWPDMAAFLDGVYRDVEYVKAECESMARQMAAIVLLCV